MRMRQAEPRMLQQRVKHAMSQPEMTSRKPKEANCAMESKSLNQGLGAAKAAKQDEFYTQYVDIQKEVEAYLEFDPDTFRGKVVYCNCDDPFESNFFKYFAANFNKLGLKKLITTSYDGSPIAGQLTLFPEYNEGNGKRQKPKALAVILDHVKDEDGDGAANVTDVELFLKRNKAARIALKGNDKYPGGDFRSPECVALLKEADIVVTNPPFSLFREYVAQLVEYSKKFLIIGNQNAITYKEIFPLIKDNKLWLGVDNGGTKWFQVNEDYDIKTRVAQEDREWHQVFQHGKHHVVHKPGPWPPPPGTAPHDHGGQFEVQQAQGDQGQGGLRPVRQLRRDRSAVHRRDPQRLRRHHGRPHHLSRQVQPRSVRDSGDHKDRHGGASKTTHADAGRQRRKEALVSKLNDGPAIKVSEPPTGQTYYMVD